VSIVEKSRPSFFVRRGGAGSHRSIRDEETRVLLAGGEKSHGGRSTPISTEAVKSREGAEFSELVHRENSVCPGFEGTGRDIQRSQFLRSLLGESTRVRDLRREKGCFGIGKTTIGGGGRGSPGASAKERAGAESN